jgi:hypothetical protein
MPTKRRRRQLPPAAACADVEREGHELPQSGSNVGEGSVPGELDFFDYLHSFRAKQWGDRIIYIYRQDPPDHNPGSGHYIEKVPHAIDKEYIKARHGGGRYLVFVKNVRTKGRERSQIVVIEGADAGAGHDEGTIADVITEVITVVQSQKVPAEEAIKAAMETLGAVQKTALDVVLSAATAQAEVVHELLLGQIDGSRPLESALGGLLFEAMERSPEIINAFATGLMQGLSSEEAVLSGPLRQSTPPAAPVRPPQESQATAVSDGALPQPAPELRQLTESQLLNAILLAIADGYSAGQTGNAVSGSIRALYPAAVPTMQKYLAMDDFLVLMWMRQQPAMAEVAKDTGFAQFYAELKAGIMKKYDPPVYTGPGG